MLELLAYLRANQFKTFIVSGGGVEFMRPWTDGVPLLLKLPEVDLVDDREGKPVWKSFDIGFDYYPSLSNRGRQRLQFDTGVRRDPWGDLYVGLNVYDTVDSRPSTADAKRNDVGVVASVGWSY